MTANRASTDGAPRRSALPAKWTLMVLTIAGLSAGNLFAETNSTIQDRGEVTPAPLHALGFAAELAEAGHHDAAAVEYRRLAMEEALPDHQAAYYWAAAYQYAATNDATRAQAMLERAETASGTITSPALLLRAKLAETAGDHAGARFYMESMLKDTNLPQPMKEHGLRRLSGLSMKEGKLDEARQELSTLPEGTERSRADAAIDDYLAGRDKSPSMGGTLGLIPGLGHMYAGEFANGFRCLILNGIFIYGMSDSADRGNWGAFSVITFFELTWYSGSIYGGRDAVERYNRDRLDTAIRDIEGPTEPKPDLIKLPLIQFSF